MSNLLSRKSLAGSAERHGARSIQMCTGKGFWGVADGAL